jgi:hypothetical protein
MSTTEVKSRLTWPISFPVSLQLILCGDFFQLPPVFNRDKDVRLIKPAQLSAVGTQIRTKQGPAPDSF